MSFINLYGRKTTMETVIRKETMNLRDRADQENMGARATQMQALQDYNIMMGNLEDPEEAEEEDE